VGRQGKVAFQELDPWERITKVWGELLGSPVIGVAEIDGGYEELYVDGKGRYFGASCIHDAFYFYGPSFPEAIKRLLLGGQAQPMLRRDQEKVVLYGKTFTAADPGLYRY
jgi:hypothetical protein